MRLTTKLSWDEWKYWSYIENTKQDFDAGELVALISREPGILTTPNEFGMDIDSEGRLWVAYRGNDGNILLASSDETYSQWEYHEQVLYVPSGSTYPTLVFDKQGKHVIAAEFLPAGAEQKEIWLYEPPYSGYGIRRIADGQYPVLAKDVYGEIFLFYQAADRDRVLYRKSSEAFEVEHDFETSDNELLPRGFRIYHIERSPYHDIYKHLMFYQANGEDLPRYKMSSPIDFYTVGLDLYITDSQGRGISGVRVEIEGQSHVTNTDGLVTFYKLPYNTAVEIKLSHPLLGEGDLSYFTISESAKGSHLYTFVYFKNPTKEHLGVQTGLTRIEWKGTELVELPLREKLGLGVDLGIEWESMLIPAYVLVYSGKQPIYEQTHLLRHYNTGTNQREALVWQEKGQSADQDVTVDIYTEGSKRPGIALRCSGSSGKENGYVGYFRHPTGNLEILKYTNGVSSGSIITKSMTISQNKWYTLRMQASGNNLKLKIWEKGAEEPLEWDLEITDTSLASGYAGIFDFDGNGLSMWSNFQLNGEEANWETSDGSIPDGWSLQFGTADRWTTEIESVEVGFDYEVVPNATVQIGDQISQTNQEGLAPFHDLQGGSLQDYEITHPDYPEVSKGTVLIPEGEFDFISLKIYEKPWDGYALEEVKVHADLDIDWVVIDIEHRQPKDSVSVSAGLTSILWVEVAE